MSYQISGSISLFIETTQTSQIRNRKMIEQKFATDLDLSDEAMVAAMNHGRYLRSAAFHSMAKAIGHAIANLSKWALSAFEPHAPKGAH
jgi:hypothetical protein